MKGILPPPLWKDKLKQLTTQLLIFSCLLVISSAQSVTAQSHDEDELFVNAASIYNFAKFTRWPEHIWNKQDQPLNICTIGNDVLINELEQLNGKIIKDHPVSLLAVNNIKKLENCHLIYIAASEKNYYRDIIEAVKGKPVLTISELPNFVRSEGIIELYQGKNQTHFLVNLEVANKAGLTLSSRLLSLAVVITRAEPR